MRYSIGECVSLRQGFALNVIVPSGTLACQKVLPVDDASMLIFFVRIPVADHDVSGPGPWPEPCTRAYELSQPISIVVNSDAHARIIDIVDETYILEVEVPVLIYER